MLKLKLYSKVIPLILIVTILFTACDVPDISKFTEQSAEMTRGIRKGVKDTESLIKGASERSDLYSADTIAELKKNLKNYRKAVKPTMEALDGLDEYLEALNALSQANKKSGENSKAVVNSVSSLVTAVSGFTFATEVVSIASGLLTLAEEFRNEKSFKKRVNLASEIVEGRYVEKTKTSTVNGKTKQITYLEKTCTGNANEEIVALSKQIKGIVDPKMSLLTEEEIETLKPLSPKEKRMKLNEWGKLSNGDYDVIEGAELRIDSFGCGVIDFLKFNLMDLKEINLAVSQSIYRNFAEKNQVVLDYYSAINKNDTRVMSELENILRYKDLIATINESANNDASPDTIIKLKVTLKNTLDSIFDADITLESSITQKIRDCGGACGRMLDLLTFSENNEGCNLRCRSTDAPCIARRDSCRVRRNQFISQTTDSQFTTANDKIIFELERRESDLLARNKVNIADLQRISPTYSSIMSELNSIKEKQNQLDNVLDSSLSALDSWAETHSNLRTAVNSKQTLTVSKLASKVREIWEILNPKTTE